VIPSSLYYLINIIFFSNAFNFIYFIYVSYDELFKAGEAEEGRGIDENT
tara:strand:- start:84 stop:230 length:147 start_codon:yes stop_codon:yes gene_type:complete